MKSAIIYYSYTGNTKKVAEILEEHLRNKGELDIIRLTDLQESGNFFIQATQALRHLKTDILEVNFDLSAYDAIYFGTPVWAFSPAPALNAYMDKCFGLEAKSVVLFATYGSGTGLKRCFNYMREILSRKGAKEFRQFSIQQFAVSDKEFVLGKIGYALSLSPNEYLPGGRQGIP
jgi:flavodoxin